MSTTLGTKQFSNGIEAEDRSRSFRSEFSGRTITLPDVNSGYPVAATVQADGAVLEEFERGAGFPDTRSHRLKLGALVPATNTTVESEMWQVIYNNPEALAGVGLHSSNILTPAPRFGNADELENYRKLFLANLDSAVDVALLAEPEYLMLGFSMEHFYSSVEENEEAARRIEDNTGLAVATWTKAASAALTRFAAQRIGVLCPFETTGLQSAVRLFENLGFEVGAAVGLACGGGIDVGHVPDSYKERAIRERILGAARLDAIVLCGTNMSSLALAEKLEPELGLPIVGINPALIWYAVREAGIRAPLSGSSRLLLEF